MIVSLPAVLTLTLPMPHQAQQLSLSLFLPLSTQGHCVDLSSLLSRSPGGSLSSNLPTQMLGPACCLLLSLISSKPCVPKCPMENAATPHINLVILFCCFILLSKSFSLPEITCIFSRPVYFSFFHWSMNPKKTKLGHGL